MSFAAPWWLLLALAIVPFLWWVRGSRAPLGSGQRWLVAGLQCLAWLLAVAALAGPWSAGHGTTHRIAVWAAGDPVLARAELQAWRDATPHRDPFHVVATGSTPVAGDPGVLERPAAGGTPDLTAAVRAALASVPAGAAGEIALVTDGRHDGAAVAMLAAELTGRGVALHVRTLPAPAPTAVELLSVSHPPRVAPGEAFRLVATLRSPVPVGVELAVRHGDELLATVSAVSRGGEQRLPIDLVLNTPGVAELDVRLRPGGGAPVADAGHERTAVLVDAPLPILHLTPEPSRRQALTATLAAHGIAVVAPDPAQPLAPSLLEQSAVVLVDDLPADAWPKASQSALAAAVVARGTGLLLTGTHANLGPGGYGSSPLLPLLPVRMPQREERRDPSIALVIILDTSGSMGGGRIELAKEVARLAIKSLLPHDKVGIVEFYGSKRWAAPLQPATNTIEITRALNRLQAGGGTIIYDALEEAHFALLNAHTRFQHILVLTDGGVESGPFEALARRMASAGQTLSTVLIGPQANSPFLLNLAQWGRGRFYACPDRFQLPELMFREPQSALLPAVQERSLGVTRSAEADAVAAFQGDELPPTGGLVEASVRTGAEVLLRAAGAPYLIGWDQGQGRVLVLAGQALGPQAGVLRDDPAYGAFLADALRSVAAGRRAQEPALALVGQERGVTARLTVPETMALPADATVDVGATRVALVAAGGRELTVFAPWPQPGPVLVEVRGGGAVLARGAACPPLSRTTRAPDVAAELARVASLSGGTALAASARGSLPAQAADPRAPQAEPLQPLFLLLALGAFLGQVLLRRAPLWR